MLILVLGQMKMIQQEMNSMPGHASETIPVIDGADVVISEA